MAEDEHGFIGRWAQRKRQARKAAPDPEAEPKAVEAESTTEAKASPAVRVEDLPEIDSLEEASDFTPFLKEGVPEALRRRALRKLWRLNPVFANLDGLNDYDEDFTDAATVVEGLKTIYKVGKGMVTEEEEAKAAAQTQDEPGEADHDEAPTETGEAASPGVARDSALPPETDSAAPAPAGGPPLAPEVAETDAPKAEPGAAVKRRWGGFS